MEKIVIFGTGSRSEKVIKSCTEDSIIAYVDNNKEKQGVIYNGIKIIAPQDLIFCEYDKIVICSTSYNVIYNQLVKIFNVDPKKIETNLYFVKKKLIQYYKNCNVENNAELSDLIKYLDTNDLNVFNYNFSSKYKNQNVEVYFDITVGMYYVIHNGKNMYFKKSYQNINDIIHYYRFICEEQDVKSPHRYLIDKYDVCDDDIVIDAGVAEGNFALDVIDKVKKIYLIEMDEDWIDALKVTFKDYTDKVVFVNKCLTNNSDENNISIDKLIKNSRIDYIKMDIEGGELKALEGASEILLRADKLKLNICAYHNNDDEIRIKQYLKKFNIDICTSKGYMFYIDDNVYVNLNPRLVRGLVRGIRE